MHFGINQFVLRKNEVSRCWQSLIVHVGHDSANLDARDAGSLKNCPIGVREVNRAAELPTGSICPASQWVEIGQQPLLKGLSDLSADGALIDDHRRIDLNFPVFGGDYIKFGGD